MAIKAEKGVSENCSRIDVLDKCSIHSDGVTFIQEEERRKPTWLLNFKAIYYFVSHI